MLFLHFIGITMGLGTSFAHIFLNIATSKMTKEEAKKFHIHSFALSKMGHIGLALLILSGLYLMTPYWTFLLTSAFLMTKLILVAILTILVVLISLESKRILKNDFDTGMKKIELYGKLSFVIGLAIVVLAILVFH